MIKAFTQRREKSEERSGKKTTTMSPSCVLMKERRFTGAVRRATQTTLFGERARQANEETAFRAIP
jgi:hypothetical protein